LAASLQRRGSLVSALVVFAAALTACGQDEAASEAVKLARSLATSYVEAYNKADAGALAALYAEDAQVSLDGDAPLVGRAEVAAQLASALKENPEGGLVLDIDSARFLTPDVLVEKGTAAVAGELTRYVCTYTKGEGGRWLIAEIQEVTTPFANGGEVELRDLGWLVGRWKDKNAEADVTSEVAWSTNGHFLRRSVTVAREGEVTLDATEVIGFDPVAGRLRSWVFDSEGGFGEGFWIRDGSKWLVSFRATGPDGSQSSAQHVLTYVDNDTFTWESFNREVDGEVLPAIDKTVVARVPEEK
jgi:uncharacterized protein (TIGR02246 family)